MEFRGGDDWDDLFHECRESAFHMEVRDTYAVASDYQRWLLSVTGENVGAGEDIRYLPRHLVDPADVPADDWWLFDGQRVAFNLVDRAGRPAGVAVTTDPEIAAYCRAVQQRLWPSATPYREYIDESPVDSR